MKSNSLDADFFGNLICLCEGVSLISFDSCSLEFQIDKIRPETFKLLKFISENGFKVSVFPSCRLDVSTLDFFGSSKKVEECLRVYIIKC